MDDYISLNKKNTELLINMTDEKRVKILEKNRYSIQLDMLSEYITKEDSLLDIGVRDGAFLNYLRKNGFTNLYGVDVYERSVEIAKSKGFDCEVMDAQCLSLDKKFDCIVMSHVLEHCPVPGIVLDNVYKYINEGGIFFIEVPIEKGRPKPTEKDAHYFNFQSFDHFISIIGHKWVVLENFVSNKRIKVVLRRI